ncbi:membrane-anchored junction protein [Pelobates fuscus]|uniref:membrane-anchored junction protein n=1 Tax=Pelobates fuscus TaxID=191477 RepID=UPI002FE450E0
MPLKSFSFPLPETRLFHTTKYVYKFKLRYGTHFNTQVEGNSEHISEEIEASIRAVLANHEYLKPFSTRSFIIFPYKSKWDSASRLRFKHGNRPLLPFPDVFTLYIEPKSLLHDPSYPSFETFKKTNDKSEDQNILYGTKSRKLGGIVQTLSNQPVQEAQNSIQSPDTHKGGILSFIASLIPFHFLFGGRSST